MKHQKTHEVGIIYRRPLYREMPTIVSSQDADVVMKGIIDMDTIDHKEFFWILLLNHAHKVLGYSEIGKGDTSGVAVNIKEIYQIAILANASSILLCHNHPSGKLDYSEADKSITQKIKKIGELLSIKVLDHLIITSESYISFADEGMI